jgi:hypothetical protein
MIRKENVKQHYIPQLYLRKFTNSDGFLTVYDINRKNEYVVRPAKESYEEFYHDIDPILFEKVFGSADVNVQFIDNFIRTEHEEKIASSLRNLEELLESMMSEGLQGINIDNEDIRKLAEFIVIHIVRTPDYRERLNYLCVSFCLYYKLDLEKNNIEEDIVLQTIHNFLIYGLVAVLENKQEILPDKYFRFFGHYLDELIGMYEQLLDSIRLILVNDSDIPFCTSSMPIIVKYNPLTYSPMKTLFTPIGEDHPVVDFGNNNEIQRVFIPLSCRFGIYFFEKSYAKTIGYSKSSIGIIRDWNKDISMNLNIANAIQSDGKVYGSVSIRESVEGALSKRENIVVSLRF